MIFLDSSFLVSFFAENDQNHEQSMKIARDIEKK
jgi:predicted nucleic acid-binding protein